MPNVAYPSRNHKTDSQVVAGITPWLVMGLAVLVLVIAMFGPFPIFN